MSCLARDGDIGLEDTESQVVIEQGQVCFNSIGLRGDGEQLALLKKTLSIQGIQELGTEQGLEHIDTDTQWWRHSRAGKHSCCRGGSNRGEQKCKSEGSPFDG